MAVKDNPKAQEQMRAWQALTPEQRRKAFLDSVQVANPQRDRAADMQEAVARAFDPSFWDEQETILHRRRKVVDLEMYRLRKQARRRK